MNRLDRKLIELDRAIHHINEISHDCVICVNGMALVDNHTGIKHTHEKIKHIEDLKAKLDEIINTIKNIKPKEKPKEKPVRKIEPIKVPKPVPPVAKVKTPEPVKIPPVKKPVKAKSVVRSRR